MSDNPGDPTLNFIIKAVLDAATLRETVNKLQTTIANMQKASAKTANKEMAKAADDAVKQVQESTRQIIRQNQTKAKYRTALEKPSDEAKAAAKARIREQRELNSFEAKQAKDRQSREREAARIKLAEAEQYSAFIRESQKEDERRLTRIAKLQEEMDAQRIRAAKIVSQADTQSVKFRERILAAERKRPSMLPGQIVPGKGTVLAAQMAAKSAAMPSIFSAGQVVPGKGTVLAAQMAAKKLALSPTVTVAAATPSLKASAKVIAQQAALTFAQAVETRRTQIFKNLSVARAPYERDTVLAAGGLSPDKIKEADVELQRAGNSVKNIERALKRVNIPDVEARALAIALKEADYEAKAISARTMGQFTRLRRTAEQGVRLSEVGFSVGAAGGAMLAPLALGANQYAQRFQGFERLANQYTKIQYDQARAVEKFGRSASEALIPILETLTDILNRLADFVKNNPFILKAIANAGALFTAVGSLAVVFGRLQSIIARVALLTLPGVPGSLTNFLRSRSGLQEGQTPGIAAALGSKLVVLGAAVGVAALAFNGIGAVIDANKESLSGLHSHLDTTQDGFVNFDDILLTLRRGLVLLADTLVKAVGSIAKFVSSGIERAENLLAGKGARTNYEVEYDKRQEKILELNKQKGTLFDSLTGVKTTLPDGTVVTTQYSLMEWAKKLLYNELESGKSRRTSSEILSDIQASESGNLIRSTNPDIQALLDRVQDTNKRIAEIDKQITELNKSMPVDTTTDDIQKEVDRLRADLYASTEQFVKTGETTFTKSETKDQTTTPDYDPDAVRLYMGFRQANLEAEREYQNQLKDQKKAFQLDALRAEREYNRSLYDAALERQRDERDAWAKHQFDLAEMQLDFDREEIKAARDRAKERAKALRELYDKLFEFAAARDVAGFVEEQKRFRAQQREEDIQAGIEKAERARKFADEVAEKNRQYAFDREQARIAYNDKLIDMKRSFETEKRERQKSFDEQLAQAQIEYGRQKDARTRDFATQLADLESNQAGLKTLRDAFYVESITSYGNYLNANKAALNSALAEVYGRMGATAPTSRGRAAGNLVNIPTHADGLPYVPHDNYIANLHKGERVLTSRENQEWGMFMGGQRTRSIIVNVSGNAIGNVVSQGDLETFGHEIAMAIREGVA